MSSPLVLDYMQLKWSCTIPSWTHRYPLDHNVNEGFYIYGNVAYDEGKKGAEENNMGTNRNKKETDTRWDDSLLRSVCSYDTTPALMPALIGTYLRCWVSAWGS